MLNRKRLGAVLTMALLAAAPPAGHAQSGGGLNPSAQRLEGSWSVTYTVTMPGESPFRGFTLTTYHTDGTLLLLPVSMSQSAAVGEWVRIGDRRFAFTHVRFTFDGAQKLTGRLKTRGVLELNPTADEYTGQFKADTLDLTGNVVRSLEGSFRGNRMAVETLQ
jgi:hypothetical protein